MKTKSLKTNFIYNLVYQILIFILPAITLPYISRTLGVSGIGTYSYTYSIVYYFMIFSMLGLNNYGNRTIAKSRDNKELMSKKFKEIHLMQLLTTTLMVTIYGTFILGYSNNYFYMYVIESMYLISCAFDINWFFFGIEEFKLTITRNIIIKTLSLILIFVFVNSKSDLWIYTLILSGGTLLSQLALWPFVNKFIDKNVKIKFKDIRKHFIPCLKLFLPVIAVTIYKVMDKTMIGLLSNIKEVGYYENSERVINVPVAIITALGTIMLPRMSNIYSKGNLEYAKKMIEKSIKFIMFLSFAMTLGLIAISDNFSIIFFGSAFEKSGLLIELIAVTILFQSWGNVFRTQYLIPKERDKEFIISAFIGAIVNLILNLILIPKCGSIGACVGTIFADLFVMLYQSYVIWDELPFKKYLESIKVFLSKALVMFIIIYPIKYIDISKYQIVLLQVFVGGIIYTALNIKYITDLIGLKGKKVIK